jgi:hypothetical protein
VQVEHDPGLWRGEQESREEENASELRDNVRRKE